MQFGTVTSATFAWIIPCFRELKRKSSEILSLEFQLPDSSWSLCLHFDGNEWVDIKLRRRDFGAKKTIAYTIKIYGRTEGREFTDTRDFLGSSLLWVGIILEKELVSNSNLLITCYIRCDTPHPTPHQPVAERKFVTCAVQTEATKSVTEKENSEDQDWSSLDMKGRKFATCAVQTEVTKSVIDKENPKDHEWSSLDMKGVALLSERMKELLIKGIEKDITICVQDKKFQAHRIILSARSPVFAMMLGHDTKENNTNTINIEDCDPESFEEFLLYVYCGRTENLTPSKALRLYYPANKYDFPVLKERCVNLLKTSLSVESICDVVLLAAKHQEKELLDVATEFFARNMKKIVVTVGWQKFMPQNPVVANELIIKSLEILYPVN